MNDIDEIQYELSLINNLFKEIKTKAKTMDNEYVDESDHLVCIECGFCINCNDCKNYGCGKDKTK